MPGPVPPVPSDERHDEIVVDVGGARLDEFELPGREEHKLIRENTAKLLGLGVGALFATAVVAVGVGHIIGVCVAMTPPPQGLVGADLEAWFRWRQSLSDAVSGGAQTLISFIAGPFGVVLGFYFRDRKD